MKYKRTLDIAEPGCLTLPETFSSRILLKRQSVLEVKAQVSPYLIRGRGAPGHGKRPLIIIIIDSDSDCIQVHAYRVCQGGPVSLQVTIGIIKDLNQRFTSLSRGK